MPPKPLQISAAQEGPITIVQISGPVDSENIELFKKQLDPIFSRKGALVAINGEHLTYLNSRAIGLLMKYYRQLAFSRGKVLLYGVNKKIVRTLDLLHIGKELPIVETKEDAVAHLTK